MEMMNVQATQAAAAQPSRPPAADADRASPQDSFKTLLEQKQGETAGQAGQKPAGEQDGVPAEVTDRQRALAAALAVQAAIVPAQTPGEEGQTPQPAAEQAVAQTLPQDAARQDGPAAQALAQTARQTGTAQPEGQASPSALPEQGAGASAPAARQEAVPERTQVQGAQPEQTQAGPKQGGQSDKEVQVLDHRPEFAHLFRDDGRYVVKVGQPEVIDTRGGDLEAQLAKQVAQAQEKGWQHVEIRLEPEHLGKLVLTLEQDQTGALHVTLRAGSERTASLLGEHADGLSALLRSGGQGQQVTVEVQRQQENQQAQYQQQYQDQGGQQQGRQPQQERRQHQQAQDFIQQLRLGLVSLDGEAS